MAMAREQPLPGSRTGPTKPGYYRTAAELALGHANRRHCLPGWKRLCFYFQLNLPTRHPRWAAVHFTLMLIHTKSTLMNYIKIKWKTTSAPFCHSFSLWDVWWKRVHLLWSGDGSKNQAGAKPSSADNMPWSSPWKSITCSFFWMGKAGGIILNRLKTSAWITPIHPFESTYILKKKRSVFSATDPWHSSAAKQFWLWDLLQNTLMHTQINK